MQLVNLRTNAFMKQSEGYQENTGYANMAINSIYITKNVFELKDIVSHDSRSNHVMSTTICQASMK